MENQNDVEVAALQQDPAVARKVSAGPDDPRNREDLEVECCMRVCCIVCGWGFVLYAGGVLCAGAGVGCVRV